MEDVKTPLRHFGVAETVVVRNSGRLQSCGLLLDFTEATARSLPDSPQGAFGDVDK